MCVVRDTLLWNAIADAEEQICNAKSAIYVYKSSPPERKTGLLEIDSEYPFIA
jgi:hypothetical protein